MGMLIQYLFCLYQAASRFLDSEKVLWAHLVLKKLSSCLKTSTLGDLPRDSPTTGSTWKIWAPWSSPKSSPAPWKRPSVLWFLDQNWSISNAKHTHVVFFGVDASLQVEKILLQSLKIHLKSISQIHGVQFFIRFPKGKSNAVPKGPCFSAALDANLIGCRT